MAYLRLEECMDVWEDWVRHPPPPLLSGGTNTCPPLPLAGGAAASTHQHTSLVQPRAVAGGYKPPLLTPAEWTVVGVLGGMCVVMALLMLAMRMS